MSIMGESASIRFEPGWFNANTASLRVSAIAPFFPQKFPACIFTLICSDICLLLFVKERIAAVYSTK